MAIEYINGANEKYPEQLLEGRELTEGNCVGLLWRYMYLVDIYDDLKEEDFITVDGRLYFKIIKEMKKAGYEIIDAVNVATFMKDRPTLNEIFESKGGFGGITSLAVLLNEVNMPKYYDDLLKSNILIGLFDKGFPVVQNLDRFKKIDANSIYDYYDLMLNDLFVKKTLDLETEDLSTGYEDFIKRANSGENMGISYAKSSPIMNYQTSGVRKGCTIVASTTSGGKSSWLAHHYILNFIEQGHRIVLIINEEDSDAWRSLLLTTVINTRIRQWDDTKKDFNVKGMSRKRFLQGNFTLDELDLIDKAVKWLEQYPNSIEYVKCFDYRIETVKKIVGRYSKCGYDVVMLDTFKSPEGGAGDNNPAWKQMLDGSKALFQACMKASMYLIITSQVALRHNLVRKLDCSHLGGATAISEIADTVVIFRDAWNDEIDPTSNKYIKPYNFMRGADGKRTNTKEFVTLNQDKKYAVAFLAKVRAGEKGSEILYLKDIGFNYWGEIGYANVAQY